MQEHLMVLPRQVLPKMDICWCSGEMENIFLASEINKHRNESTYSYILDMVMKESEDSLHTQNDAVYIPSTKVSHAETDLHTKLRNERCTFTVPIFHVTTAANRSQVNRQQDSHLRNSIS
jgi:hypothetical protein